MFNNKKIKEIQMKKLSKFNNYNKKSRIKEMLIFPRKFRNIRKNLMNLKTKGTMEN